MRTGSKQKLKYVIILEILRQETDADHPMQTNTLLKKLEEQGIECSRETLYSDIKALNENGFEIFCNRSSSNEYYIEDRGFDVPEIRILIDAVNAASFITPKKTVELVGKVAALGGSHRGEIMKSETKIYNTTKHSNEYIYYNINEIELAITLKKKVSFYYFDYNEKKEKVFRKDKKRYYINPYAMLISNDNYYLIGYNDFYKNFLHFRIDRMTETRISHYDIVESEEIDEFDLAKHYRQLFGIKDNIAVTPLGDSVDLFIPTDSNVANAFEGIEDMEGAQAINAARSLVDQHILYRKKLKDNKECFAPLMAAVDTSKKVEFEAQIDQYTTTKLVDDAGFNSEDGVKNPTGKLLFTSPIANRFRIVLTGVDSFVQRVRMIRNNPVQGKIYAILGFAKTDVECATLSKLVKEYLNNPDYDECNIIYITSKTPLGADLYSRYKDNLSDSMTFAGNDKGSEAERRKEALKVLKESLTGKFLHPSLNVNLPPFEK